jgi:transcriptional regulator with XRE-family HTH domain
MTDARRGTRGSDVDVDLAVAVPRRPRPSQHELARQAVVSRAIIADFENGGRIPTANNLAAIRAALEAAGVIFIDEGDEGPGVRLRKNRGR